MKGWQQGEVWMGFSSQITPRAMKERAQWHEANRERAIASILLELYLMAANGFIRKDVYNLTLQKSGLEDDYSQKTGETVEVSCVPRDVFISAVHVQEILAKQSSVRGSVLRKIFSSSDGLPVSYGVCDSLCEEFGVAEAFRSACLAVLTSSLFGEDKLKLDSVILAVKQAFDNYKITSRYAFTVCIEKLTKKLTFPKPLPDNEKKWSEQLLIIQAYSAELTNSTAVAHVTRIGEVEKLVNAYKEMGPKAFTF